MRGILRRVLTWLLVVVLGGIAIAVAGEWFIEVARDKGWYEQAGQTWDRIVSAVLSFVSAPIPLVSIAALAGLVAGLWIDQFLLRKERRTPAQTDDPNEGLGEAIEDVYRVLGVGLGSGDSVEARIALSSVDTFFLQLNRREGIVTPDIESGGVQEGICRAVLFLNRIVPPVRILDFEEARRRAAEIVPSLNAMNITELSGQMGGRWDLSKNTRMKGVGKYEG